MKFDLDNLNPGVMFETEGGGKVWLRVCAGDDFRKIRKQTTKKKVEFRNNQRYEYEVVDEELQSRLLWDFCIVNWDGFYDGENHVIPCNIETKNLLMGQSLAFSRFVLDKIDVLTQNAEAGNSDS